MCVVAAFVAVAFAWSGSDSNGGDSPASKTSRCSSAVSLHCLAVFDVALVALRYALFSW